MADDNTNDQPAEESKAEEQPQNETPAEEAKTEEASPVDEELKSQDESKESEEKKPMTPVTPSEGHDSSDSKKESKPVSKELEGIIEKIEKLSVLELADLVHALEDRFGVTAAAPMAIAAAGAAPAGEAPAEEQTTFNVILSSGGANKISVIKAVRELVPTLGLKEAKDLVEGAPKPVLEGVNKEAANEAKTKLTAAGGTVELQ